MSLVPVFKIGIWNVWIFMLAWIFFHLFPFVVLILKIKYRNINIIALSKYMSASVPLNKTEKKINYLWMIIMLFLLIYTIFLPLPLGTAWFYTGLALFLLGLVIFEIIVVGWATTPLDEPVTKGLYLYSRHPIYLAVFLQYIGISVASVSWLFLLFVIGSIVTSIFVQIIPEERFCLEKYGSSYREYMKRTPRWIGIPKS